MALICQLEAAVEFSSWERFPTLISRFDSTVKRL